MVIKEIDRLEGGGTTSANDALLKQLIRDGHLNEGGKQDKASDKPSLGSKTYEKTGGIDDVLKKLNASTGGKDQDESGPKPKPVETGGNQKPKNDQDHRPEDDEDQRPENDDDEDRRLEDNADEDQRPEDDDDNRPEDEDHRPEDDENHRLLDDEDHRPEVEEEPRTDDEADGDVELRAGPMLVDPQARDGSVFGTE
jgi:hypothetical protein